MNRHVICVLLTVPLAFFLQPTISFSTGDAGACHCFRNRTFDPANKFASDDYLLTTTFNSLLASEFNISKRQIIMMKMREGIANNDLVTALYLSRETGLELADLLRMKKTQSWQDILEPIKSIANPAAAKNFQFITTGASDEEISTHITNLMIVSRFDPAPDALELMENNNLNSRETILVFVLAGHTGVPDSDIVDKYKNSGLSWSEIAHNFGMEPAEVGKLLEEGKDKNQ